MTTISTRGILFLILIVNSNTVLVQCKVSQSISEMGNVRNSCPLGSFSCHNESTHCVPQIWICNGSPDCKDASDELGCGITNYEKEYWDLLFPPKPGKDDDEHNYEIHKKSLETCKYEITENDELLQHNRHEVLEDVCFCHWEKFLCTNMYLKDLSFIPSDVEYLDLTGSIIELLDFNSPPIFHHLKQLILSGCSIKGVPIGGFYSLKMLETLHLTGNNITLIQNATFMTNIELKKLFLGYNQIHLIKSKAFKGLSLLNELDLRYNLLKEIQGNVFEPLKNLRVLHLNGNRISNTGNIEFNGLKKLEILSLANNYIASISSKDFIHLKQLKSLYLSFNHITTLHEHSFGQLSTLMNLHLEYNQVKVLNDEAFFGLYNLRSLNLEGNFLRGTQNNEKAFKNLSHLNYVYFDEFWMCGWTLHVRHCEPKGDGISSAQNLLDNLLLRFCVWIIGLVGVIGNICVIVSRLVFPEPNPIHSFYIKNLAVADLLMGIFLLSIGIHDVQFRGTFLIHQYEWRHSFKCQISGILSTLSSEASVLILALITLDRYLSISQPFSRNQTSPLVGIGLVGTIWIFSFLLSYLPFSGVFTNYFMDFYSTNGLCLPLQIHNPFDPGWEYSFTIFVMLNTMVFFFISYAYWVMFHTIQHSALTLRTNQERQDGALAKRFGFVVLTDFLCWGPIITTKILAMLGLKIPSEFYAWIAIFVLPVNSMLNPIIYTITTKLFKQKVIKLRVEWKNWGRAGQHIQFLYSSRSSLSRGKDACRQAVASNSRLCGRSDELKTFNTKFSTDHIGKTIGNIEENATIL